MIALNLVVPEVKVFIQLLVTQFILDKRFKEEVQALKLRLQSF